MIEPTREGEAGNNHYYVELVPPLPTINDDNMIAFGRICLKM
jgi:hypothetical protein